MPRSTILLLVFAIASYGKVITHSDEIHPNYRVQLPQLGTSFHDPMWEEVLQQNFPQFDAVLHETEDGRMLVGFLDRYSPGRLIIWTHLRRPQQNDAFDSGLDDDEIAQRLTEQPPGGNDPDDPEDPQEPLVPENPDNPDDIHTPEPATLLLVGLGLSAVALHRKRS